MEACEVLYSAEVVFEFIEVAVSPNTINPFGYSAIGVVPCRESIQFTTTICDILDMVWL